MTKILSDLKKMTPSFILTFSFCFMLFIYEPIIMYANNIEDFWFDFSIMIWPTLLIFLVAFLGISVFLIFANFISKKFFKKIKIFEYCLLAFFVVFIYLYIQGNYLIGNLPALDGTTIEWNKYTTENIISIIVLVVLFITQIILVLKLKLNKCIKIVKYASLVVVAMLTTSLVSIMLTTDTFVYKSTPATITSKDFHAFSSNKNFIVLVVDAVDSLYFNDVLKKSDDYQSLFKDFTYFPDTISAYGYTRDSIPFLLSGVWNENETTFTKYSTKVLNESKFLNKLEKEEYDINIYSSELIWEDENIFNISNALPIDRRVNLSSYFRQELKYILFKYMPYMLKKYSKIETMNFNYAKTTDDIIYDYNNIFVYDWIINNDVEIVEDNVFKFVHMEGGHVPFNQDKDLNFIEGGTYDEKLLATMKLLDAYLDRLKESNIYDNSVIIVVSDHGYNFDNYKGRQNPLLLVKGIDEHHSKMKESDKAISFADFQEAYFELLEEKSSRDIFSDIGNKRERRFMLYEYTKEDYMYEYIQSGKAWDEDTFVATGKEYILK